MEHEISASYSGWCFLDFKWENISLIITRKNVLSHVELWGMVVGGSGAKVAEVNGLSILDVQADFT